MTGWMESLEARNRFVAAAEGGFSTSREEIGAEGGEEVFAREMFDGGEDGAGDGICRLPRAALSIAWDHTLQR